MRPHSEGMSHQPFEERKCLLALARRALTCLLHRASSVFRLRAGAPLPPMSGRPHQLVGVILLTLGLVGQLVLLWLAGELVDLYVSAVELWAELARKHLELTL